MILNFVKIKNLVKYHRQMETRDGMTYMRMKKRPLIFIKDIRYESAM